MARTVQTARTAVMHALEHVPDTIRFSDAIRFLFLKKAVGGWRCDRMIILHGGFMAVGSLDMLWLSWP